MTIQITKNFTLRRVAGQLTANIGPFSEVFTAAQARDAAEAFNIMAVMLEADGDVADVEEEEAE
ncbi:hypothetical protein ACFPOD_04780 [Nitratireductor kimnyeongensis]|uniref:Uncharacterized protein n=1 Tax=Nitratireductor kimnyeongensis TaxID=430679 RepID=A0ABW0T4V7_9HYPH|nr:hypothetical protein [Nitratireductor kimnyeongensis]QZZ34599.1 hypothetical protein KW403_12415 [Nitratireductor kimnyeongensis]